jgi:L-lactate permease
MKEAKDILRVLGIILLGLFVFTVVAPLALKLIGFTLFGIIGGLIWLAIALIKLAVVLAIGYLILVGIRALLR